MRGKIGLVSVLVFGLFLFSIPPVFAGVLKSFDFSGQPDGNAVSWLKSNGFEMEQDADEIKANFRGGKLYLETNDDIFGIFTKKIDIKNVKKIRIEWGVDKYPAGSDWEKGKRKEAVAFIVSFGKEKIDSGSYVIPNLPYFISLFLGEKEQDGKAYKGKYFQKGGRFLCTPCQNKTGETVVTEVDLTQKFQEYFGKAMPDVSGIGIEVDSSDTDGKTKAFIKKVEFLSE